MMDEFLHLMKSEWRVEISTNAEKTRKKLKSQQDRYSS